MKNKISFKTVFKIGSATVLMILILCMTLSVFSCSQNNSGNNDSNTNSSQGISNNSDTANTSESSTEAPKILSDAPVKDYGGYTFRILSKPSNTVNHHWDAKDIVATEETGDIINDAVYKRNTTICDEYNIKITRTENDTPSSLLQKSVKAGSDDYDLMFSGIGDTVGPAQNGVLINLKNIPYIDLTKPWYDQNANSQLSIDNKLYTTFCDFTIVDKDSTWVYLFNKKLIQDLGLENPYQLVKDGKWTIDKMTEMCKGASKDLNGDGVMTWEDQFGWEGECWDMNPGIISAGVQLTSKDSSDLPVYNGLDDKGMTAFTKLLTLLGDKNLCLRSDDVTSYTGDLWADVMDRSFTDGRILFLNGGMNRVTLFRSMDTDFGIIPSPKFDENQSDYCNTVTQFSATSLAVPATASDLERTGILTDALCAESHYTLIPAYYDVQLKTKLARDDDSGEMLDLIFSTRRFELSLIYGWGSLSDIFTNAMKNNTADITSSLEKAASKVQTAIQKTIDAYSSNQN
ncbi:MAG: extracellular solute-binding protein [Oscillospiraceae bacterium]|nr:extracellular solute-binding protein [Oscillospiraceae bacterium]